VQQNGYQDSSSSSSNVEYAVSVACGIVHERPYRSHFKDLVSVGHRRRRADLVCRQSHLLIVLAPCTALRPPLQLLSLILLLLLLRQPFWITLLR